MKFVEVSAGNAQRSPQSRLGAAASFMPRRPLAIVATLTLALALPVASAHASDPLLSGYAGPGGGEQVVLGGTTVDTTKSSSSQDADLAADAGPTSSAAESGGANSTLTRKPQHQKSSSSSSKDEGDDDSRSATNGGTTTATPAGAPEVVAYPTRAGDVGDLPVSAPGMLLIVLGVAAATLVGLGLRRLSGFDRAPDPQVSDR